MHRITVVLVVGTLLGCALSTPESPNVSTLLNTGGIVGVILPQYAGKRLLKPCTRRAPDSPGAPWRPGPTDVERFEAAIPRLVAAHKECFTKDKSEDLKHYVRQYTGFSRDGRRFIYANFLHSTARKRDFGDAWLWSPAAYCDGGHEFFGIEFDLDSGRFTAVDFDDDFSGSSGPCSSLKPAARAASGGAVGRRGAPDP